MRHVNYYVLVFYCNNVLKIGDSFDGKSSGFNCEIHRTMKRNSKSINI